MIYGLSDLHLDYTGDKSMEVFGSAWENYEQRMFETWKDIVKEDDYIVVPGDISWALRIDEAYNDLKRIESLPGKKIFLKGNHDLWWSSLTKIKELNLKKMFFLQNNSIETEDYVFIGTRGWLSPKSSEFSEDTDRKIYNRELTRLKLSLDSVKNKEKDIICLFHYPPVEKDRTLNDFGLFLKEHNIKVAVYGHLHAYSLNNVVDEVVEGIEFHCISADYLQFIPRLIRR